MPQLLQSGAEGLVASGELEPKDPNKHIKEELALQTGTHFFLPFLSVSTSCIIKTNTTNFLSNCRSHLPENEMFSDDILHSFIAPYITVEALACKVLYILNVYHQPLILHLATLFGCFKAALVHQVDWGPE